MPDTPLRATRVPYSNDGTPSASAANRLTFADKALTSSSTWASFNGIRKHLVHDGGVKIVNYMSKPVILFRRNEPGSKRVQE
ncbi:hypothetical protein MHUMG1_08932 [Metarhizium humberi]|uniref:Uncharacterized protein n=1 Tax=Metarhizium humberi TaxID=2596975 RepID=A0A9P8M3S3_9HYPO|nr:hypothetical protein MHUMG1_08932 [Metarhizium humberi]